MKVERNRTGNKYTFTSEDKGDEKFLDKVNKYIDGLEEKNKKLKEDVERLIKLSEHKTTTIMGLGKNLDEAKEENRKLKEKQKVLDKENCKLIDENVKLKKRIYQNVHGGPRIDYQEFCKKNGI